MFSRDVHIDRPYTGFGLAPLEHQRPQLGLRMRRKWELLFWRELVLSYLVVVMARGCILQEILSRGIPVSLDLGFGEGLVASSHRQMNPKTNPLRVECVEMVLC